MRVESAISGDDERRRKGAARMAGGMTRIGRDACDEKEKEEDGEVKLVAKGEVKG